MLLTKLKAVKTVCCSPEIWAAQLAHAEESFDQVSERYIGGDIMLDIYGDQIQRMEIAGDAAIIPVVGVLATGLPSIAAALGYVDPEDIEDELDEAMANEAVNSIWLAIDSPGGMVTGIPELAAKIAAIQAGGKKPVRVYARSCYSAALWIAAGANVIVCLGSGGIGSVGCYTVLTDSSGYFESLGLKLTRIASGISKGLGADGKVTEAMIAETQADVDAIAAEFKSFIAQYRPVNDEDMNGQCYNGKVGAAKGFCDGTASSLDDAMKLFTK